MNPFPDASAIDLAGAWRYFLDRHDDFPTPDRIPWEGTCPLPGSVQEHGLGDEPDLRTAWTGEIIDLSWYYDDAFRDDRQPGAVRVPFWLQPRKTYVGAAWFQRTLRLDAASVEADAWLATFERPHGFSELWINGERLADGESYSVPWRAVVRPRLRPGENVLTLRVDNRDRVGLGWNSHSISDHTQTNWNGVVGMMRLRPLAPRSVDALEIHPEYTGDDDHPHALRFVVHLRVGSDAEADDDVLTATLTEKDNGRVVATFDHPLPPLPAGEHRIEFTRPLPEPVRLWDEFTPFLYVATLTFARSGEPFQISTGFRRLRVDGARLLVNGRPTFFRGTLDCCTFPRTGYPSTDPAEWRRILGRIRDYGFNHVRYHSWCPPEAAFAVADELGLYLQIESASWPNSNTNLGSEKPLDDWLYREGERIVRAYGNHPSFVFFTHGNEPGRNQFNTYKDYLRRHVTHFRQRDPRRLVTAGAGWPVLAESDYHLIPDPRLMLWGAEENAPSNALPPTTDADYATICARFDRPVLSHEVGQWCAYPDFREIEKYTGALAAKNFEIIRDRLRANGLGDLFEDFFQSAGRWQMEMVKLEIERLALTPNLAGFQLLGLNDFPGQGTALVGLLDAFWDEKRYVDRDLIRMACGPVTVMARLDRQVVFAGETVEARFVVRNASADVLDGLRVQWRLERGPDGTPTDPTGECALPTAEAGALVSGPPLQLATEPARDPARWTLRLALRRGDTTLATNRYPLWTAASETAEPSESMNMEGDDAGDAIVFTRSFSEAESVCRAGGTVVWCPPREALATRAIPGYTPMFWNTAWTRGQAPHTLGIHADPTHPMLADFPTAPHADIPWWGLLRHASAIDLTAFPPTFQPTVYAIDSYHHNRRLAWVAECRVGRGRMVLCGGDLTEDSIDGRRDPSRSQFRRSLTRYLRGGGDPDAYVATPESLRTLLRGVE